MGNRNREIGGGIMIAVTVAEIVAVIVLAIVAMILDYLEAE